MTPVPTLFDAEPTQGRTRASDPQTSRVAASRCRPGSQRWQIAQTFASGAHRVSADMLADRDPHGSHRSAWSARLGQLVRDERLRASDPIPGHGQDVLSYVLTDAGRAWVAEVTGVRP